MRASDILLLLGLGLDLAVVGWLLRGRLEHHATLDDIVYLAHVGQIIRIKRMKGRKDEGVKE